MKPMQKRDFLRLNYCFRIIQIFKQILMKKSLILAMVGASGALMPAFTANAQSVELEESDLIVTDIPCKTHYYTNHADNWFLQLGAGINTPFVENNGATGQKHKLTGAYNIGVGRWFSPYLAWRLDLQYSQIRWQDNGSNKARYGNANFDLMWDMTNSLGGVDAQRPVSVIPFVGVGGTFAWDFKSAAENNVYNDGRARKNSWTLPVSAGVQVRFRMCRYVDFFLEGRAQFYGDNFNLCTYGKPVDINLTALGGFNVNFGGRDYKSYNRCANLAYVATLNDQVNALRADLAATGAALAVAESQLPCPEVEQPECPEVTVVSPMLATVRFTINSAVISSEEMVNVFNTAEYMKQNPEVNLLITGYADKDTGTAAYNKALSQKRAQAVYDALTKTYGIDGNRLAIDGMGSQSQPYSTNNWNRIVIFTVAE